MKPTMGIRPEYRREHYFTPREGSPIPWDERLPPIRSAWTFIKVVLLTSAGLTITAALAVMLWPHR